MALAGQPLIPRVRRLGVAFLINPAATDRHELASAPPLPPNSLLLRSCSYCLIDNLQQKRFVLGGPSKVHRQGTWTTPLISMLSDYGSVVGSVYYFMFLLPLVCYCFRY